MIKGSRLGFSYFWDGESIPVFEQANIELKEGEWTALLGCNGCGKSTLVNLIPRFYDVTGGRVTIDGKDVRDLTLESLRNQIGLVQQDVYLFCGKY